MKNNLLFIIAGLTLFAFPKENSGQTPTLGAATSFALFTSAGAFTNTGSATIIIGDIGTNVGAISGFPPGTVVGQTHVADPVTAQAAIDVAVAYTYLDNLPCDTSIGITIGSGQILTPRTYCTIAASTLNGNLILDAQGDTGAVFIFKINGALDISASSQIILINAASFKDVYWQVNGAVTFGDSSLFKGTVISNGALNLLQGSSIQGRGLSNAGAITINNSVSTLPVKLLSFKAACNNKYVLLEWTSATEINNDYYSIEKGTDRINWKVIGKVAGAGNSSIIKSYTFLDKELNKDLSYYRVKQTDFDGKFKYSAIAPIESCGEDLSELAIYPNPTNGQISLTFNDDGDLLHPISIYNVIGKSIYSSLNYQSTIDLSDLEEGIYFLHFNSSSKSIIKRLVIKK